MKSTITLIFLLLGLVMMVSYSVKRYGIRATLADANTTAPIAGASVVVTIDGDKFTKTASRTSSRCRAPVRGLVSSDVR